MLTTNNLNTPQFDNQSFALFRKGVLCALNGLMALEDRRLPVQYGGGIVSRSASGDRIGYSRDGAYWSCAAKDGQGVTTRYGMAREVLVDLLWSLHTGVPTQAPQGQTRHCPECGTEFLARGNQKYCSADCSNWYQRQRRNRAARQAVANA